MKIRHIQRAVRRSPLQPSVKLTLIALIDLMDWQSMSATIKLTQVTFETGLSKRTIQRSLSTLEDMNIIIIEHRFNEKGYAPSHIKCNQSELTSYIKEYLPSDKLTPPYSQDVTTPIVRMSPPYSQTDTTPIVRMSPPYSQDDHSLYQPNNSVDNTQPNNSVDNTRHNQPTLDELGRPPRPDDVNPWRWCDWKNAWERSDWLTNPTGEYKF
jgi:DNA-binding transcriptional ArsR family regulator